jgi:hypothetical protein
MTSSCSDRGEWKRACRMARAAMMMAGIRIAKNGEIGDDGRWRE